jgi:hypothetical protein
MNVKPNTANAKPIEDKRSGVVRAKDMPWQKMRFPGCEMKTLLFDPQSGLATMLVKMAPGAELPDHEHVLIEQTYVLEGSLVDKEGPDAGIELAPANSSGGRPAAGTPLGRRRAACSSPCSRSPTSSSRRTAACSTAAARNGIRPGRIYYRPELNAVAWMSLRAGD